ncbi:MAG: dUTP diphosphatase [Magnetococcales bacterium]|nr:dUTP diphosphatase [Magnetococcales bacterium]
MTVPLVQIALHILPHGEGLPLPRAMTPGSAGMDVMAAISTEIILTPGQRALIPTGLTLAIPLGWEIQIRPRSGLAFKHGVTVLNAPGTIDADYRGEVGILLINHGDQPFTIRRGERIAQMILAQVTHAQWHLVDTLETSVRGAGGFGHTGQ